MQAQSRVSGAHDNLPDEVWLLIFKILLGARDDDLDLTPEYDLPAVSYEYRTHRKAATSRLIAPIRLVSCRWCGVAAPLFWRILRVNQDQPRIDDSVGPMVREVVWKGEAEKALIETLAKCTGIKSLIIHNEHKKRQESPPTAENSLIMSMTITGAVHPLYPTNDRLPLPSEIVTFISQSSSLTSLTLSGDGYTEAPNDLSLLAIKTLSLLKVREGIFKAITTWSLPSLTHLTIKDGQRGEHTQLITKLRNQLLFLELDIVYLGFYSGFNWIVSTTNKLPNLRELVVACSMVARWLNGDLPPEPDIYPSVTHLGFAGYLRKDRAVDFFGRLAALRWKSLQCVRIMLSEDLSEAPKAAQEIESSVWASDSPEMKAIGAQEQENLLRKRRWPLIPFELMSKVRDDAGIVVENGEGKDLFQLIRAQSTEDGQVSVPSWMY